MGQVLVVHLQQSGLQPCSRGDSTDPVLNSTDAVLNRHLKNSLMDIASQLSENQRLRFSEPASCICFPFGLTICLRFWNRGIRTEDDDYMQRSASSRVLATTTARHRADRAQSITPCWCCQTSGSEIPGQRAAWPSMPMMPARASVRTRATQNPKRNRGIYRTLNSKFKNLGEVV